MRVWWGHWSSVSWQNKRLIKVEPKSTAGTAADPVLVPCSTRGAKCKKLEMQPVTVRSPGTSSSFSSASSLEHCQHHARSSGSTPHVTGVPLGLLWLCGRAIRQTVCPVRSQLLLLLLLLQLLLLLLLLLLCCGREGALLLQRESRLQDQLGGLVTVKEPRCLW